MQYSIQVRQPMHASGAIRGQFLWISAIALALSLAATSAGAQSYTLTDLGTLGGTASVAATINAAGQVVGASTIANNSDYHAFLYSHGSMTDLGTLGGTFSAATAINGSGQIVGSSSTTSPNSPPQAFLYANGSITDLSTPTPDGTLTVASGISPTGEIVGVGRAVNQTYGTAFSDVNGVLTNLGTLGGTAGSEAYAINSMGQIVGDSYVLNDAAIHGFLYQNGQMADLGTLGGIGSQAFAINSVGQIVGVASTTNNVAHHAFLYGNGQMTDLGTLVGTPGAGDSKALAINTFGVVVGYSDTSVPISNQHAFIDSNGQMKDLNSLLTGPLALYVTLTDATGINDAGQIVADGVDLRTDQTHAYLLTTSPVPLPPAVWLLATSLGSFVLLARRRRNDSAAALVAAERGQSGPLAQLSSILGEDVMEIDIKATARRSSARLAIGAAVALLAGSDGALAACPGPCVTPPCSGAGAPTTAQTQCLTAVQIPGNPLGRSRASWVNPSRAEYYLADISNAGIDIIDTEHNTFKRTIGGFKGVVLNRNNTFQNIYSGPDGVTSHGRWLYAGDGDSTLKVIDLDAPHTSALKQVISTGGRTAVTDMALTTDGKLLLAANSFEDPPFVTLFEANGAGSVSSVAKILTIFVDSTIVPAGFSLELGRSVWDPQSARFYTAIPIVANNPPGCNSIWYSGPITCEGGLLVTDPTVPTGVAGPFNPATNTGVVMLHTCAPNGITVGLNDNLLLGCTPGNNPYNTTTLVINATTKNYANIAGITGSQQIWYNNGDKRYYTASSKQLGGAALGVIDATSVLIETIPSGESGSIAVDSKRNKVFVPELAPYSTVGNYGDPTGVGAGVCGGTKGCVAVYIHDVDGDHDADQ